MEVILNFLLTAVQSDRKKDDVKYPVFIPYPMISGQKMHWYSDQVKPQKNSFTPDTSPIGNCQNSCMEMFNLKKMKVF